MSTNHILQLNMVYRFEQILTQQEYGWKSIKKYATSLGMREIKVKTTLRSHLIPLRMADINNSSERSFWLGYGAGWTLLHACRSMTFYGHLENQFGCYLENWKSIYFKTKLYHAWSYTQKTLNFVHKGFLFNCQKQKTI